MKKTLTLFLVGLTGILSTMNAQVTEAEAMLKKKSTATDNVWMKGATTGVNMSQTALVNWAAGGQESVSMNAYLNAFANYKKGKLAWDNMLNVGYGILKQKTDAYYMKTDDKVDILSKIGVEAFKNFYYAGLVNFKTQMDNGYKYPDVNTEISRFMAPAYVTAAFGMDFKPDAYISAFLAPVTGKMTIVNDDVLAAAGAFGVDPGKKTRSEFGGYLRCIYSRSDFKPEWLKNVALTTKVDLFSNYLHNPQNVDVNWENMIAMKVNKYISVNLSTHLIYDDDVRFEVLNDDGVTTRKVAKLQFKEIFGAGVSFKF
ncbi:MAG: DUF3078 domain-containing protein [Bacteroidales bacterium]|nr:DUF3078 domain-containing protein [Bacteroidales bacterium]